MINSWQTDGLVLRVQSLREVDRQYVLYTRERGKIIATAKGSAKIQSKLAGHLLPGLPARLMLVSGVAGERLIGAEQLPGLRDLYTDAARLLLVRYTLDLVEALTIYDVADRQLYDLSVELLGLVARADDNRERLLVANRSTYALLTHAGYQPPVRAAHQVGLWRDLQRHLTETLDRPILSGRVTSLALGATL